MEQRELGRTGLKVSVLGFGGAPLGGMYGALDEAEAIAAVRHAIDAGINLVDTSPYYGPLHSEVLLGKKPFSRQMNRKLADYFGVDVRVLAAGV